MGEFRRTFARFHIGLILFMAFQIWLFWNLFQGDVSVLGSFAVLYLISAVIMMSPIGEFILCAAAGTRNGLLMGAEEILQATANEILSNIRTRDPSVNLKISWKVINSPQPGAVAIGTHTIAVSHALLDLPREQIEGVLADEIAHLVLHHNILMMIFGYANPMYLLMLLLLQILRWIITVISAIFFVFNSSFASRLTSMIMTGLTALLVGTWNFICSLFLAMESRQNVYDADEYAMNLGYGYGLAAAIDETSNFIPNEGLLRTMVRTHPSPTDRIRNLQNLGVPYRRYY